MSRVYTAESSIHGTGVFSSVDFSPGEIILRIDDSRVVTDTDPLDPAKGEFEHHCDYLAGGKMVLMQLPERHINHRCDPNTFIRTISGDRYVVALGEIRPGDEITYDYCVNGDGDTAWDCTCSSSQCRRRHVSGFFHLPVDVQVRYMSLLEDWFVAEHRDEVEALKRRVEAPGVAEPPAKGPSPVEHEPSLVIEEHGRPGIALVVNPILSAEETAALFEAAWGEQAPDSPPAIEPLLDLRLCLRRRSAGWLRQARLGRRRSRICPGHHRASRAPAAWDREETGRASRRDRPSVGRRVAACRFRAGL